ncbi:3'-5' exonuclease [Tsuneonella flava]|uniref:3'-5' exonuclease n=1 Tax=Tsuneonella flava TaxID=2055955 RepID=A0ABX7KBP0_9SPHN|nr:exonuclease domain-containing protein [Tsuneonella flava]QSB45228.1 3'-5' exonuclease [Tsuneonella flava]
MAPLWFADPRRRFERAFARAASQAPAGPLADYYAAGSPRLYTAFSDAELVCVDLETDGLTPQRDAILEAGTVPLVQGRLQVGEAKRTRFRPIQALSPASVAIHGITDDAAAEALREDDALAQLLPLLARRVLVAHFAQIEAEFLDRACRRVFGGPFVAPFVCTMQLQQRWFGGKPGEIVRLGALRARYGLPHYAAHDGVGDALACGELLLAQVAHKPGSPPSLAELLRR